LKKIDPEKLRAVVVYFATPSEQVRAGFRFAMHSYGIHHEHIFAGIAELTDAIKASPPDLLILDADLAYLHLIWCTIFAISTYAGTLSL
jgi:hypothetical protein